MTNLILYYTCATYLNRCKPTTETKINFFKKQPSTDVLVIFFHLNQFKKNNCIADQQTNQKVLLIMAINGKQNLSSLSSHELEFLSYFSHICCWLN